MSDGIGPIGGLAIGTAILAVGAACWFGWWDLYGSGVNRENDIVQHSNARQENDIQDAKNLAHDWITTTDPGQKAYISNEFCADVQNITVVPPDLQADKVQICAGH